jgi:hypothetical protein
MGLQPNGLNKTSIQIIIGKLKFICLDDGELKWVPLLEFNPDKAIDKWSFSAKKL